MCIFLTKNSYAAEMSGKKSISRQEGRESMVECPVHNPKKRSGRVSNKRNDTPEKPSINLGALSSRAEEDVHNVIEKSQLATTSQPSTSEPSKSLADADPEFEVTSSGSSDNGAAYETHHYVDDVRGDWFGAWSVQSLLTPPDELMRTLSIAPRTKTSATIKALEYTSERSERIIDVLKTQLAERDDSIAKMVKYVDVLEEWKNELDHGQNVLAREQNHEYVAQISLLKEKFAKKSQECQTLKSKLQAMEQEHMLKDSELKKANVKINEYRQKANTLSVQLEAATADRGTFNASLQQLKRSFKDRQNDMKLALDKEYQSQIVYLLDQIEAHKKQNERKDKKAEQITAVLRKAEQECSKLRATIMHLNQMLDEKVEEVKSLRDAMLDLEERIFKDDQNASSRISAALAAIDGARKENAELKARNRELRKELDACLAKLATLHEKGVAVTDDKHVKPPK
ncbi:proteophosphoglycan PPG1, putative [Babesia ovata]|uniref:Proteophosphoglycan PPG1, putative n=1 Tax=Babesia ovata TaxID=189622 RepID=A0A2H6KD17_9APIC|nr:proteophosphoglycan PPG1, putative [Babesia ovata]GBE60885.1 proteophosphoglycan PPG1, putative [Babesia ovata]